MTDLGILGGDNSEAIWPNEAGDVVGSADLSGGVLHHPVLWRDSKIHDLGTVGADPCSRGRGLNASGQVVGGSSDCSNFLHAFVWDDDSGMVDLNTVIPSGSGYQLTNAFNINDRGEILAKAAPLGFVPNDDADLGHLVLLVPCEPETEDCAASLQKTDLAASHLWAPSPKAYNSSNLLQRDPGATWRRFMYRESKPSLGGIMATVVAASQLTPERIFNIINAHQQTEAMKAALELEIFTAIAEGNTTAEAIARRCQCAERGVRILCDFLTIHEFLRKDDARYDLARESALFLDRHSRAYIGTAIDFLLAPHLLEVHSRMTEAVRRGGSALDNGILETENPDWVTFAQAMMPLMHMPAEIMASELRKGGQAHKVLDIAAGHGMFGIAVAKQNPGAQI